MVELKTYETEVVIAGGGLAGIVAAYELLDHNRRVLLIDKDRLENFGGLAKQSFGGVHMIGTRHQRRLGIQDSAELAWQLLVIQLSTMRSTAKNTVWYRTSVTFPQTLISAYALGTTALPASIPTL